MDTWEFSKILSTGQTNLEAHFLIKLASCKTGIPAGFTQCALQDNTWKWYKIKHGIYTTICLSGISKAKSFPFMAASVCYAWLDGANKTDVSPFWIKQGIDQFRDIKWALSKPID